MRARIRDFLESRDGWIFSVVDYIHTDGVRSLLRYIPDEAGERIAWGRRYRKLDFDEAFEFLRAMRPEYVSDVHVVPFDDVRRFFRPAEELPRVRAEDVRVDRIVEILEEHGVPERCIGITGSMLLGLHSRSSDIDLVVYGRDWWRARDAIADAKHSGSIQELDSATWMKIYMKRKPSIPFDEFVAHEMRKGNRGMIDGTYFDLLFTRDWDEIEPVPGGRPIGRSRIVAEVTDARYSFDSPGIFRLDHEIGEILCYSHTYAGQAFEGEMIEASGVVEETPNGLRMVVGTTREAKGEWIRSLTLMSSLSRGCG